MTTTDARSRSAGAAAAAYPWLRRYPAGVRWDAPLSPAPLHKLLDTAAARYGSKTCTNFLGKLLSYAEIGALTAKAAAGLQQLGVKKGTKDLVSLHTFSAHCPHALCISLQLRNQD